MTASSTGGAFGARSIDAETHAPLDLLPLLLIVVAEAAWIAVIGGLVQEYALQMPVLGIPSLMAFVAAGILISRLVARRLDDRWPFAALAITVLGATGGWLMSPETRSAIGAADVGHALAVNPGGWFAGLAVLRGFAHASLPLAEATVARMLGLGIPLIAMAAALGRLIADPWRTTFEADTLVAAIAFVATGTLGLAFVRLGAAGAGAGLTWRRNPAWAALIAVLVLIAVWFALPASTMTGQLITLVIGLAIGPLLVLGVIASFQRPRRLIVTIAVGLGLVVLVQAFMTSGNTILPTGVGGLLGAPPDDAVQPALAFGLGGAGLLIAALSVILLARLWMRRLSPPDEDIFETRSIDEGPRKSPKRPGRRRWTRQHPADAAAAYVALVHDLQPHPLVSRGPAETPAEHARRLREDGHAGLSMELLAADYALARYGAVALNPAEQRRAIARWRRLRLELARVKGDLKK